MTQKLRDFETEFIEGGTYFSMPYEDDEDATLALTRPKRDGGELSIELARHAKAGVRKEGSLQENTLMRIKPLAEVPGYKINDDDCMPDLGQVRLAALRPGYLYVFLKGRLWRELVIDEQGTFSDVDLAAHREAAVGGEIPDERPDEGEWQDSFLVPVMLQGESVLGKVRLAHSEIPWSWAYIEWLEAHEDALKARTSDISCAYAAWSDEGLCCEGGFPAERISKTPALRARDLGVELMLGNPAAFTPEFTKPDSYELCDRLARLWEDLDEPPMDPESVAPEVEGGDDVLADVRGKDGVVSVAVPDPLFRMRHSLTQMHLAMHYLDALDQSLVEEPLSNSAMLIRQALFDGSTNGVDNPLSEYQDSIDREKLERHTKQAERRVAVRRIQQHLEQLGKLTGQGTLGALVRDFTSHPELGACEAYGLVGDLANLLQQLPGVLAAQGEAPESQETARGVLNQLLSDDTLNDLLTPSDDDTECESGSGEMTREWLQKKAGDETELEESHLDSVSLESLGLLARNHLEQEQQTALVTTVAPAVAGKVAGLVRAAVGGWSEAVLKGASELMNHTDSVVIRLDRLFAGVTETLSTTESELSELKLMRRGDVDFTRYSIIGVHGRALSFGLTSHDRDGEVLSRKNDYLYGDLINDQDQQVASTSPKRAFTEANDAINRVAGTTWVFALPVDAEPARRFSQWQLKAAEKGKAFVDGPGMTRALVGLAVFNLGNEFAALAKGQSLDLGTGLGIGSGAADLTAASMKLHLAMNQNSPTRVTTMVQRPWFDLKSWWIIGNRLQQVGASTLVRTVGLVNFFAGALMVGSSSWDLRQALHRGDPGAIQGHAIAVTGGLIFLAAPLMTGLLLVPGWGWAVLGLGLVIGGTTYAAREGDDAFARLLRQGPLGTHPGDTLGSQEDPDYYPNLLTQLSPTRITAQKYSDWEDGSPGVQNLGGARPDDYVVTVSNPLISRLRRRDELSLEAEELVYLENQAGRPELDGNRPQYHLRRESRIKEISDWVSGPGEHAVYFLVRRNVEDRGLLERLAFNEHHRLRVGVQFRVNDSGLHLTLPAPTAQAGVDEPLACAARLPQKERRLLDTLENEPVPYWAVQEINLPS